MAYSSQFSRSKRGQVNQSIIDKILPQLNSDQVFIDTSSIVVEDIEPNLLENKIAVCYSSIDWENTGCITIRTDAHDLIKKHSSRQVHIGNTRGKYYFSYWVEFIRQCPDYFFNVEYTKPPDIEKLYLCYNRKIHPFRKVFLDKLECTFDRGIVSNGSLGFNQLVYDPKDLDPFEVEHNQNNNITNDIYSLGDPGIWNKALINVVTESCKHTNVFLSEKTWKPIIGLRPFLILGDDNLYLQLKDIGFDTFDDIFGDWWKNTWWQDRADAIVDILKNFDNKTSSLNMLYSKLLPRLLSNRKRFEEYTIENFNKICELKIND